MASFPLPTTVGQLSKNPSLSSAASFSSATTTTTTSNSQFFLNQKRSHAKKFLTCRAAKDSADKEALSDGKFDRRDILVGLGAGLYGTTAVSGAAFAAPIDVTKCGEATTLPTGVTKIDCCPPPNPDIIDFTFPSKTQPLRIRPPAHTLDAKYVAKFKKAMQLMRDLPSDDPHSFAQQAAIHCAYCDSSYQMVGFPNKKIDVHFSWLFFPFHRWYLYFYEKILGKLIDDPTFGLPFWNWDSPAGAPIPSIFADTSSPLYDVLRDASHQPPLMADLNYSSSVASLTGDELIKSNNTVMYNQMVSSAKTPELFFGKPYRAGDDQIKGQGAIENIPHTQIHIWTGDPNQPNGEDMGRFYSAGRDPIFYSHHANVDRMWNIWKTLPGKNRKDFTDTDYLDSAFLFYDENKQLVRVKVRDCLDTKKLGYDYKEVPLPWLKSRPVRKAKKPSKGGAGSANAAEAPTPVEDASTAFPKVLDKIIKVNVPRPKKSRTQEEKEDEEEILEIDGIEYDGDEYIKFDVYINDEDEVQSGPANAEFAGAFSNVPFKVSKKVKTNLSLGITELLEDLGADDDEGLVVAIVPRTGTGKVTIGSVKIKISS